MRIARTAIVAATAAMALAATATPAMAENSSGAQTTFTADPGSIRITAPAGIVNLGTVRRGERADFPFGHVTVTDNRAPAEATWQVTVLITGFTNGDTGKIPADLITYTPANLKHNGAGTGNASSAGLLSAPGLTAVRYNNTGKLGDNTADWDARISFDMPSDLPPR